jgi:hypothetical protein
VFYVAWPDIVSDVPQHERTLPIRYETVFCPTGDMFSPGFLDASAESFGPEGTPDLVDAVRRLHAALQEGDAGRFIDELALKFDESERAYPGWPGSTRGEARSELAELCAQRLVVRPFEVDKLRFEQRSGGRVAVVHHADGGNVLDAYSLDDPEVRIGARLVLTKHRGRWAVFR